jgi:multidrug efflux pump subunit AcrB
MMGLVRVALRRPYTSAISAFIILLAGFLSLSRMVVDIFPTINIPVVLVAWNYGGLSAEDMERRVVLVAERTYAQSVDGVDHIESQSLSGTGIIKIFFKAGADLGGAMAQINAVNNQVLRVLPPGMTPPILIPFSPSNVGVVQMTTSSKTIPEEQILDYTFNFIRLKLFTIPGISLSAPYGGKARQIIVDIDPARMAAKGVSPSDVVTALQSSNVIVPAGVARIGEREYNVAINSSPPNVAQFSNLPLAVRNGIVVTLGDVAKVGDSFANQTNIVHVNGERATYVTVMRHSDASTIAVVEATRALLPEIKAAAPEGLDMQLDFDQSVFVRSAISNVLEEALISSILVSLMILFFLGSWRNMVIVSASIPLSIFAGIAGLYAAGQTINLMTLGGLALAIGLLVDNATVTIENIHRNQSLGKPLTIAILDGCAEVVTPLTVATLAICIVFLPVFLLEGAARFLFIPLGLTVVLAMLASYVLSFTIVPTMAHLMLTDHGHATPTGLFASFENGFAWVRDRYEAALTACLNARAFVLSIFAAVLVCSLVLAGYLGKDFFPTADVGIIKLHYRAPAGTKLEVTEKNVLEVQKKIREIIGDDEIQTINDVVGVPFATNLALIPSDNVSSADADILIQLKKNHRPSIDHIRALRKELPDAFPGAMFYFQNADIVSQVLNFGMSAPIDIQISDPNFNRSYELAQKLLQGIQKIPGIADAHITQILDYPTLQVDVDRLRAAQLGVTQRDVSNNLLVSLSSSSLVAPSYFLNPANNVNYFVAVRQPVEAIKSVDDLMALPVSQPMISQPTSVANQFSATQYSTFPNAPVTRMSDIASVRPRSALAAINHYSVQRVIDVTANADGRDLGGIATDVRKVIADLSKDLPVTTHIDLRGQPEVMDSSFTRLAQGLVIAIILVYALLVVLFQSWIDPFIIMMAVPGALIGIIWMLALTGTTINVESLMGTIMTVGISVSNSILVVSFANDLRSRGTYTPFEAVIESGKTRLRPILMTALAMILGMIPMALGLGEAGEQNAPLGRAVIGGLLAATLATLVIVPIFYTLLRRKAPRLHELDAEFEAASAATPSVTSSTSHAHAAPTSTVNG